MKAYEKATGLTVKVVLPAGTLAGFDSPGVNGLYREDEALRLLLEGTGLNYRVEDAATMVVGVQAKDTVSVTSSVTDSVLMTKFTEPLIETPQSIAVVPQFVVQDQGGPCGTPCAMFPASAPPRARRSARRQPHDSRIYGTK